MLLLGVEYKCDARLVSEIRHDLNECIVRGIEPFRHTAIHRLLSGYGQTALAVSNTVAVLVAQLGRCTFGDEESIVEPELTSFVFAVHEVTTRAVWTVLTSCFAFHRFISYQTIESTCVSTAELCFVLGMTRNRS